jgi:virulence-associated protein VagC
LRQTNVEGLSVHTAELFIRKGKEVVLSPRLADWSSYLAEAPWASADFMEGVEDLRVQERKL